MSDNFRLVNPLLKGVDPYSETLTAEQKEMIIEECRVNILYFLSMIKPGFKIPPGYAAALVQDWENTMRSKSTEYKLTKQPPIANVGTIGHIDYGQSPIKRLLSNPQTFHYPDPVPGKRDD